MGLYYTTDQLIGMSLEEAQEFVSEKSVYMNKNRIEIIREVSSRSNENDYQSSRLNVFLNNGKITIIGFIG
jgi:hypothetical protein